MLANWRLAATITMFSASRSGCPWRTLVQSAKLLHWQMIWRSKLFVLPSYPFVYKFEDFSLCIIDSLGHGQSIYCRHPSGIFGASIIHSWKWLLCFQCSNAAYFLNPLKFFFLFQHYFSYSFLFISLHKMNKYNDNVQFRII